VRVRAITMRDSLSLTVAALLAAAPLSAAAQDSFDASRALREAKTAAAVMPPAAGRPLPAAKPPANPWKAVRTPARGLPESIGAHSAGCLRGAERMPLSGPGFEVMRPSRLRYFGHPRLLEYLRTLALDTASAGYGTLMLGDMAMPRGGPFLNGHASHQTGLDADIWYRLWPTGMALTDRQRETLTTPEMVVPDFERLNKSWDPRVIEVLKLAAASPEIERIFVNPVIKREVCAQYAGQAWVGKLRPWWGHDDHFHARLTCTPGDAECQSLADPIPPGDGCGAELDKWFTPESKAEARKQRTEPGKPPVMPKLPAQCKAVLAAP
jgi:penicillin-insensitive murein endopeptidase